MKDVIMLVLENTALFIGYLAIAGLCAALLVLIVQYFAIALTHFCTVNKYVLKYSTKVSRLEKIKLFYSMFKFSNVLNVAGSRLTWKPLVGPAHHVEIDFTKFFPKVKTYLREKPITDVELSQQLEGKD